MKAGKRPLSVFVSLLLIAYSALPAAAFATGGSGDAPRPLELAPDAIAASSIEIPSEGTGGGDEVNLLIVKYGDRVSESARTTILENADLDMVDINAGTPDTVVAAIPDGVDVDQVIKEVNQNPAVEYAELDRVLEPSAFLMPADPDLVDADYLRLNTIDYYPFGRSWHLRNTGALDAWGLAIDDASYHPVQAPPSAVKVAVIDTGVHLNHPDFDGRMTAGFDFFESYDGATAAFTTDADVTPVPREQYSSSGHGTGVAGVLAAAANNGVGSVGTGFDVEVVAYKVAGRVYNLSGYTDGTTIILGAAVQAAIRHAADNGVKIINLSLGSPRFSQAEADAVAYAQSKGCIVVAATGNAGGPLYYPAALPDVVSVGSVRLSGGDPSTVGNIVRAESSNFGPEIDLVAPGYAIWAPTTPGYDADGEVGTYQPGYNWWFGTSLASPQVAGALALLWRANPTAQGADVVSALVEEGTADLGTPGFDQYMGHGLLDIDSAYRAFTSPPPVVATSSTYESAVDITWSASPNALQYDVRLNGIEVLNPTEPSATIGGLTLGQNTIEVRAVGMEQGASKWRAVEVERKPLAAPQVELSSLVTSTGFVEVTVTPVAGATNYEARLTSLDGANGSTTWTLSGTTETVGPLPAGDSRLEIRAVNDTAQGAWSTFTVQHAVLGGTTLVAATPTVRYSSTRVSWTEVPGADWYEYRIGSGPLVSAGDDTTSTVVSGLVMGTNQIQVRARTQDAFGPWASTSVTYELEAPVVLPSSVTTSTTLVEWSSVENADVYEYRVRGRTPEVTVETAATVIGLVHGANTVEVRAVNEDGDGPWGSAQIAFSPPAAPVLSSSTAVRTSSVAVSWTADARAVSYDYQLNGGNVQSTGATQMTISGLKPGANTIRVRSHDGVGPGAWGTRTVTFTSPTKITLATPTFVFSGSTRLSGKLTDWQGKPLAAKQVLIERSIDGGKTWPDVKTVVTTSAGNWSYTYNPSAKYERTQLIRVRYHGATGSYAKAAAQGKLLARVYLTTPKLSVSRPYRNRTFTATNSLKPRFTAGTYPVRALVYKKQKNGSYVFVKSFRARASNYSSYSRLTAKVKLDSRGEYRVRFRYETTSKFTRSYSSYRYFTVR